MNKYADNISVLTRYEVKAEYREKFCNALREYTELANRKETNIMAECYKEQEYDTILWLVERWSTQKALEEMRMGTVFSEIVRLSEKMLTQPEKTIYVKDLEPLSKMEWRRKPGKADTPVTIMLFVDCRPGTEDNFKKIYHAAMPQFRRESGVINYQLSQWEDDPTRFVTYEKFNSEAGFQYHLGFPPIQPVIDYLNTSIQLQPFQKGLHRLLAL